jgi:hypothetical protein
VGDLNRATSTRSRRARSAATHEPPHGATNHLHGLDALADSGRDELVDAIVGWATSTRSRRAWRSTTRRRRPRLRPDRPDRRQPNGRRPRGPASGRLTPRHHQSSGSGSSSLKIVFSG